MPNSFLNSLFSGAFAGIVVDTALYPIDTIKTRMQSSQGFFKTGGFSGLYKGFSSAFLGAAPGAALFFIGYDSSRNYFRQLNLQNGTGINAAGDLTLSQEIITSCIGEITACIIRCPTENVKQNAQISNSKQSTYQVLQNLTKSQGGWARLYRGYFTLVCRECPFAAIQMPLWQYLKSPNHWNLPGSVAGCFAGVTAAFFTTPLDVIKTRQMLARQDNNKEANSKAVVSSKKDGMVSIGRTVFKERGVSGLFAGWYVRCMWMAFGGLVFLGGYDLCSEYLVNHGI